MENMAGNAELRQVKDELFNLQTVYLICNNQLTMQVSITTKCYRYYVFVNSVQLIMEDPI